MPEITYSHALDSIGCGFPTTSSIAHALAHSGATAPHSGKPYTESFLMGVAGGAAFGYFSFAYKGYDPQANILTRNTFGNYGWDYVTERLRIPQDVMQSTSANKAQDKLTEVLESGSMPIAWVEVFSLGYEPSEYGAGMWMSIPVAVLKYESDEVAFIDRSGAPITVARQAFDEARGKIKKDKFRIIAIDHPEDPDLRSAVLAGLQAALDLYNGNPPRGSGKSFGFNGYELWQNRLTKPSAKESWAKVFPPGRPFFCGLASAYHYSLQFWQDSSRTADRSMFARFLSESAGILDIPELKDVASLFEEAGSLWAEFGRVLLPDGHDLLAEARATLDERDKTFRQSGNSRAGQLKELDERSEQQKQRAEKELTDEGFFQSHCKRVAAHLGAIREKEQAAVQQLAQLVEPLL